MFVFVRKSYLELSLDQKKELCSASYRICTSVSPWTANAKQRVLELLESVAKSFDFVRRDTEIARKDIQESNPLVWVPSSILQYLKSYFSQFYVVRNNKLCLPAISQQDAAVTGSNEQPSSTTSAPSTRKIRAITEETWWVVRVKNEYRMCKLTFDRGEYWEMVEYQGSRVHNPQYRFPKYDNRVIYEFKEHITPDMFTDKIQQAVAIRKEALQAQANKMLKDFEVVLIARHPTGGTLVGGVVKEDEVNWYLDTYNENGDHIFYGDKVWILEKKSRCTVVQTLRKK